MAINFVENFGGRARVRWSGALVLLAALLTACALIPMAGFWLAFGDSKLVSTALTSGFAVGLPLVRGNPRQKPAAARRAVANTRQTSSCLGQCGLIRFL